jgi:nucleoside-triphosphatase
VSRPHILLTAPPRTGKTTVIRRLAALLRAADVPVRGFVSDEVREHGHRVGFTIEEFGGEKAVMAHVSSAPASRWSPRFTSAAIAP